MFVDGKFVCADMDLSEFVRDQDFDNFVKVKAYLASLAKKRYVSEEYKMHLIREDLIYLAQRGDLRSLAMYLEMEEKEKLLSELVEKAKAIEAKNGPKTPEEWLVVANLHINDYMNVAINDDINTVKKLNKQLDWLWVRYNELLDQRDHCRYWDPFTAERFSKEEFKEYVVNARRQYCWYMNFVSSGPYANAIKQAMVGYYERYVATKNPVDIWTFAELTHSPAKFYMEYEVAEKRTGTEYCSWKLEDKLVREYGKSRKSCDLIENFIRAKTLDIYGPQGLVASVKYDRDIEKQIHATGNQIYTVRPLATTTSTSGRDRLGNA